MSVVDWEGFKSQSTPFWDLFLFVTNYGLSYPWRLGRWAEPAIAFRATYLEVSWLAQLVREYLLTYCQRMEVSPRLLEVFFPVFLAERALEEREKTDPRRTRNDTKVLRETSCDFVDRNGDGTSEVRTWRTLFQEYAHRDGPACFG
jgi:hypothetical protein